MTNGGRRPRGACRVALGLGLAVSCYSGRPSIGIRGHIVCAGALGTTGCALELRDRNDPRRSAGAIPLRAGEPFSVVFTEGQDKIVSDDKTQMEVLVSCEGFTPVERPVWREHLMESFDLGLIVVRARKE
jgi:hypothetical protein